MSENNLKRNLSLLTDFYELTMANGYLSAGRGDMIAVYDMFFRTIPDDGGFAIFAGLEQLIEYLKDLSFTDEDIRYLRSKNLFTEDFLKYLRNFRFACDVWAPREGTPIFPQEPVVIVRGPIIQTQLVETMVLLTINHQSLIATKSSRIVRAAAGRPVMEFGSRRAQGYDAAIYGARASYIAGCAATACTIADRAYGIPAIGTMAHSWVQSFPTEYEAFRCYAEQYPQDCTLLIDTYSVLKGGIQNAIKVFDEVVVPAGYRPKGVRIDSGDIAYLSKKVRKILDDAGYPDVGIVASNSLDEYIISDLLRQGAQLNSFGVGEKLITSRSHPVFGGVYKLVCIYDENGREVPKIKISESVEKVTTPCFKNLYRFYSKENGKAVADYVTLHDEVVDLSQPLTIFDPLAPWKKKELTDVECRCLMEPIFEKGKLVYAVPGLEEVRSYCAQQLDTLWEEVRRFENPHRYYVDLSQKLWDIKNDMLNKSSR